MAEILGYAVWVDGTPGPSGLNIRSFAHSGAGTWTIYFNFSVENAVEIASIGHFQTAGWITAYGEPPLGQDAVSVMTGTWEVGQISGDVFMNTVPADLTFQLLVLR
jgi:hypothetical protein